MKMFYISDKELDECESIYLLRNQPDYGCNKIASFKFPDHGILNIDRMDDKEINDTIKRVAIIVKYAKGFDNDYTKYLMTIIKFFESVKEYISIEDQFNNDEMDSADSSKMDKLLENIRKYAYSIPANRIYYDDFLTDYKLHPVTLKNKYK